MRLRTPVPSISNYDYLRLKVPSRSRPGAPKTLHYYPSGLHHCEECLGHKFMPTGRKRCRHFKMTTMDTSRRPFHYLKYAYQLLRNRRKAIYVSWGFVRCQYPELRPLFKVKCFKCPLYPRTCNIHPIYFGKRARRKPTVWKLQSAIYNGRRKDALRLLRQFIKEAE
jgi:hypothetical protein